MTYAKAIVAAAIAFLTGLITALDSPGITLQEWLTSAVACLVALGAVFQVPNKAT